MLNPGKLIRSFGYAFRGIWVVICTQQNMRIHLLATILVVAAGFFFRISIVEWCLIIVAIVAVMAAEAFNTVVEIVLDLLHPDKHPEVGKAKDISAGAVLVTAIAAAVIGILVFGQYITQVFKN